MPGGAAAPRQFCKRDWRESPCDPIASTGRLKGALECEVSRVKLEAALDTSPCPALPLAILANP